MVVVEKYPLVVDAFSLRFGVHFSPPEPYYVYPTQPANTKKAKRIDLNFKKLPE